MIPNVLKQLANSEKGVVVGLLLIAASSMVFTGHLPVDVWVSYSKWLAGIYVGGKSLHGAAREIGKGIESKSKAKTAEGS